MQATGGGPTQFAGGYPYGSEASRWLRPTGGDPTQFPGGLCARECLFALECPGTMKCVTIFGSGELGVCLDDCTGDPNACRQGYACTVSTDSITGEEGGICYNSP